MRLVSLFSGCGGLDLGLERSGFRTVLANDSDRWAACSYRLNFPDTPFFEGSVSDLTEQRIRESTDGEAGAVDLVAGGPPCPPYSKSRFYLRDKPRGLGDQLADVTLRGFLNVLKIVRPRAFLFENVPGFAYRVHSAALELLIAQAADLGYDCSWQVLNAADYGVPQMRHRFLMLGGLGKKLAFPEPTHTVRSAGRLFADRQAWRTAGEAIGDLDTAENADDIGHRAGGAYHELLKQIPPGENYLFLTKERGHPSPRFRWRSRYWSFLLKLSPELPSWTIQAVRSNNMGPFHWRNRILRVEEVLRLQTFPDSWHLCGTIAQQWRQLGNAVPPLFAEQLGRSLFHQLAPSSSAILETPRVEIAHAER